MANDNLFYTIAGLFALAALLNFIRGLKRTGGRRNASFALAAGSIVWAATTLTVRFVGFYPAALVALAAIGCMLLAAVMSGRVQ